jgi:hypothetical protein
MLTAPSVQLAGLSMNCTPLANYPGLFPVNPGTDPSDPRNLNTSLYSDNQINSGIGKLDYRLNDKHSFSGMYFISPGDGILVDYPTGEVARQWLDHQYARSQIGSGNWTWVPNSRWVNAFRVGYSHYYDFSQSADGSESPANYSYNGHTYHIYTGVTNPNYFGLPLISIGGGFSFYLGNAFPGQNGPNGVYTLSDSASYQHGQHALKFGGELLVIRVTNKRRTATNGLFPFSTLQRFFAGNMNTATIAAGDLLRHYQYESYGFFAQDDWRLKPRLTLNMGSAILLLE